MAPNNKSTHISRRNLAIQLREDFSEEIISDWIAMGLSGRRPVIVDDTRTRSGKRVEEAPRGYAPLSNAEIQWFMKFMLERRDGLPSQSHTIQAEIRSHFTSSAVGVNLRQHKLSGDQLAALAASLDGIVAPKVAGPRTTLLMPGDPEVPDFPTQDSTTTQDEE